MTHFVLFYFEPMQLLCWAENKAWSLKVNKHHSEFDIKMQPEEVGAFAWLDQPLVQVATGQEEADEVTTFQVQTLLRDSGQTVKTVETPVKVLSLRYDGKMGDSERLSSGTIFALEQWMKRKRRRPE